MKNYKPACFKCGATHNLKPYQSLTAGTLNICPRCNLQRIDRNHAAEIARLLKQAQSMQIAKNKAQLIAGLQNQLAKANRKIGK
jgi:hypothetical protein